MILTTHSDLKISVSIILEIWAKEYNKDQNKGNWFALPKDVQHKILREKLNSSDYRYFRTAPGKF